MQESLTNQIQTYLRFVDTGIDFEYRLSLINSSRRMITLQNGSGFIEIERKNKNLPTQDPDWTEPLVHMVFTQTPAGDKLSALVAAGELIEIATKIMLFWSRQGNS